MAEGEGAGEKFSGLLETWGWYGEAVKWFVAIASGVLAFGFGQAKDRALEGWVYDVYLGASVALAFAAVAGLFCYLQLLGFANLREKQTPTDAEKQKGARHLRRMGASYMTMVTLLAAGLLGSAAWWVATSLPADRVVAMSGVLLVTPAPGEPALIMRLGEPPKILVQSADGSMRWQPVQIPPRPEGN